MAAKLAVFLFLNLLLFAIVHGCDPAYTSNCPAPPSCTSGQCKIDTLKLKVCANVLRSLNLRVGVPASEECCELLRGLVDLDASVCLCTAIKANVLNILDLIVPVDISLLLNHCGMTCPCTCDVV